MINLQDVSITFDEFNINYDDFQFQTNKITFIKGPNGSGKTTLLKAIAGLQKHNGTISYQGVATFNSQKPILFHMSVYDNITYPIRIRNLDLNEYKEKIQKYITLFDLTKLEHTNTSKLSSGELMKISIIRSIIFNPDILLLDEPTTALDIESIKKLTILLQEIKKDMTILISSHDRLFIEELSEDTYQLGDNYVER